MTTATMTPNPFTPEHVEHPYPVHEALRESGVARVPGTDMFAISRYEDVEYVLMHPELYSNIVNVDMRALGDEPRALARLTGSLPSSDLPEHNYYRTLVGRQFSARGVQPLEERIREIVDRLIDGFANDGRVELARQFATPLTVLVFVEQMGIPDGDVPKVKEWVDCAIDQMAVAVGMLPAERAAEVAKGMAEFRDYLIALAHDRRQHPRDDLLSTIVTTPVHGFGGRLMLDQELEGMLVTLLMGGTETTLNMICSGIWLLLTHPEQFAELLGDYSLIPNFIEEALRIESPVQGLFRRALVDSEVAGVPIPAHSRLWVMYGSANSDPSHFPEPRRFDIHRANAKESMAFGAGVHYCLGAPLARMEGRVAFERLLTRLNDLSFAPGLNDFQHGPNFVIRGFKELWLDFDRKARPSSPGLNGR